MKQSNKPADKFYDLCAGYFAANWDIDSVEALLKKHPERCYCGSDKLREQIETCFERWLAKRGVTLDDFHAFMPKADSHMFEPTRTLWPGSSVDSRVPPVPLFTPDGKPLLNKNSRQRTMPPSDWLSANKPVEQMTWAPGRPMVIEGWLIEEGGWIERPGVHNFNLYRPPTLKLGDPDRAKPWLDHVREVYPDEVEHLLHYMAHRVQRPDEKINHGLLLVGNQGVGKDTMLEPLKHAVGPWNFREIRPRDMFGDYNGFVRAVVMRVNEVHDLGDEVSRFDFYEGLKIYTAAPPDTLRVNEKYVPQHYVPNVCGVIMTSNYLEGGIYLPDDDRRTYVAASDLKKEDFKESYWNELWRFYEQENGYGHVAAFLAARDLSQFNPKAPPPRTPGWHVIVNSNRAPEETELADVLDRLQRPEALTLAQLMAVAKHSASGLYMWISDRKNRRQIPHRLSRCGYVAVANGSAESGLWVINGKRQIIYARKEFSQSRQLRAARALQSMH